MDKEFVTTKLLIILRPLRNRYWTLPKSHPFSHILTTKPRVLLLKITAAVTDAVLQVGVF